MSAKLEIVSEYSGGPSKTKIPSKAALDSQQKHPNQASFAQIDPKLSTIIEADIDPHNLDKRSQDDLVWEPAKATKRDDQLLQKKSASFFQPLPRGDHPKPETSSPSVAQGRTQLSSSSVTSKLTRIPSLLPASQTNIYNMKTQKISLLPIQVQKVNRDKYLSFDDKATRWNVSCSLLGLLGLVCQVLEVDLTAFNVELSLVRTSCSQKTC